jgi:hypothetical protein
MHTRTRRTIGLHLRSNRPIEPWWRLAERYRFIDVLTCRDGVSTGEGIPARPSLLPGAALNVVARHCEAEADVQLMLDGSGLSVGVLRHELSALLPNILDGCARRGLSVGRPVVVRPYSRCGVEAVGRELNPRIVLLITAHRGWRERAARLTAVVAVGPVWGVYPTFSVRLCGTARTDGFAWAPSRSEDSHAVELALDLVYMLAVSRGCHPIPLPGLASSDTSRGRPGWKPDGLHGTSR